MKQTRFNNAIENIMKVWDQRDDIDYSEGMRAYERYNRTLRELGDFYGIDIYRTAGVFSALSPNNDYIGNLRSCRTVLWAYKHNEPIERVVVTTYNTNRSKAFRIIEGEHFYSVFKGFKTRNFFRNLTEPTHPEAVTIDGHMVNVARDKVAYMSESGLTKNEYRFLHKEIIKTADGLSVLPSQLQAVLWFTWKRINNILYNGQTDMFIKDNIWRNYIPEREIKRFTYKDNETTISKTS